MALTRYANVAGATSQSQSERRDGDGDGSDDYELPAHAARYVPPDDAEVGAGAIPETAGTGVSRRPSGSAESRASAAARPVVPSAVADDPSEVRRAPLNEQRAKEGKRTNAYWTQRWPNASGSPVGFRCGGCAQSWRRWLGWRWSFGARRLSLSAWADPPASPTQLEAARARARGRGTGR